MIGRRQLLSQFAIIIARGRCSGAPVPADPRLSNQPLGLIIIDTPETYLYPMHGSGCALRYDIEGFTWSGVEDVSRMSGSPD